MLNCFLNPLSDTAPSHQQGLTLLRSSRDLVKYAVNTALQKLKEVLKATFFMCCGAFWMNSVWR